MNLQEALSYVPSLLSHKCIRAKPGVRWARDGWSWKEKHPKWKPLLMHLCVHVCVCAKALKLIVFALICTKSMGRRSYTHTWNDTTFTCNLFVTKYSDEMCKVIICVSWGLNHSNSWSHPKKEFSLVISPLPRCSLQVYSFPSPPKVTFSSFEPVPVC